MVWPLALPGTATAGILCFILAMNAYATPYLLGGPRFQMMAPLLYWEFSTNNNWPFASAHGAGADGDHAGADREQHAADPAPLPRRDHRPADGGARNCRWRRTSIRAAGDSMSFALQDCPTGRRDRICPARSIAGVALAVRDLDA